MLLRVHGQGIAPLVRLEMRMFALSAQLLRVQPRPLHQFEIGALPVLVPAQLSSHELPGGIGGGGGKGGVLVHGENQRFHVACQELLLVSGAAGA